jgi:uncharacterized protein (DUF1778 family)
MLSRREHQAWSLTDREKNDYRTDEERRFFEAIKNPPEPSEDLKELAREFGKFATRQD